MRRVTLLNRTRVVVAWVAGLMVAGALTASAVPVPSPDPCAIAGTVTTAKLAAYEKCRFDRLEAAVPGNQTVTVTATPPAPATVTATVTRTVTAAPPAATTTVAPTTTAAATSTTAAPAGTALPVGNLPGWTQTLAEDFTTPVALGSFPGPYSSRFFPYTAGAKDTSGYGTYSAAKTASVAGGVFDTWLRTEGTTRNVNATVVTSPGGWGQTYGRYAIRLKADVINGYKIVPLLWPDSEIWDQGEIDYPEVNVLSGGDKVTANIYKNGSWVNIRPGTINPTDGWHTYITEWTPGQLRFYADGVLFGQTTTNVPTVPMHWVLQFETFIGAGAPPATAAGHVQVDWVAMYSYAP